MELSNGVYFVSGIDTDAGKSFVTGELARRVVESGKSCITQKFIQTGGENIDIAIHRKVMGIELLDCDKNFTTCPVTFSYPASPHLAAEIDGLEIDFDKINRSMEILKSKYSIVLVEGAGGLHVPLKGLYTTADWLQESGLPLIFVTSGKLGSINHTILSLEVCRSRLIDVAVLAYNHFFDNDAVIAADTLEFFKRYIAHYHPNTKLVEIDSI